jgi:hypothetical protein
VEAADESSKEEESRNLKVVYGWDIGGQAKVNRFPKTSEGQRPETFLRST